MTITALPPAATAASPARHRAAIIRNARLDHDWTQADLARLAGYSQPTISRIERGGHGVNDTVVLGRLAEILNINPAALGIIALPPNPAASGRPRQGVPARPSIGAVIKHLRCRRGLSQVACAQLMGYSETWLSEVERGARGVDSVRALRELARVLDVDVHKLIEVVL